MTFKKTQGRGSLLALIAVSFLAWTGDLRAAAIGIPNGSFELPVTSFVNPNIDSWQKTSQPPDFPLPPGYTWELVMGGFKNTPVTSSDHIDNCDGNQAAYVFGDPQAGLFQDYDSTDWSNSVPTHAFNAKFEPGRAYTLTVGVNGGGGGMSNGATMEISIYYRDPASNRVTLAATTITNTLATFPTHTHFTDFQARIPAVRTGDAWAGQHIGVQMISTVSSNMAGGYWDLDNVRLSASEPVLKSITQSDRVVQLTVESEPGFPIEMLATTDPTMGGPGWASLGTVTNITGTVPFVDTPTNVSRRFYRARLLP